MKDSPEMFDHKEMFAVTGVAQPVGLVQMNLQRSECHFMHGCTFYESSPFLLRKKLKASLLEFGSILFTAVEARGWLPNHSQLIRDDSISLLLSHELSKNHTQIVH